MRKAACNPISAVWTTSPRILPGLAERTSHGNTIPTVVLSCAERAISLISRPPTRRRGRTTATVCNMSSLTLRRITAATALPIWSVKLTRRRELFPSYWFRAMSARSWLPGKSTEANWSWRRTTKDTGFSRTRTESPSLTTNCRSGSIARPIWIGSRTTRRESFPFSPHRSEATSAL